MKKLALILVCWTIFWCGPAAGICSAQIPSYLLLRAPARTPRGHAYYPARPVDVTTLNYAYGWFGAKSRRHATLHRGYYSGYLEWSKR